MFTFKIVVMVCAIAICNGQYGGHEQHGSSSSYASISFGHANDGYNKGNKVGYQHAAPVAVHAAPVAYHSAPVAVHAAPVAYHAAPVAVHAAPPAYGHGQGQAYGHQQQHYDYYAHPKYEFKYEVNDQHTKDQKSQYEVRDGDSVHGEYSLVEPDGTTRTVKYTADGKNGFNAHVSKSGHSAHPQAYAAQAAHGQPKYTNQQSY
ncbi:hypothetical protein FQA39_LY11970 [Lamprigera yunnana]|nr:hypothetical protein FQA39_LY11970 [Lamprigera yunnana]